MTAKCLIHTLADDVAGPVDQARRTVKPKNGAVKRLRAVNNLLIVMEVLEATELLMLVEPRSEKLSLHLW